MPNKLNKLWFSCITYIYSYNSLLKMADNRVEMSVFLHYINQMWVLCCWRDLLRYMSSKADLTMWISSHYRKSTQGWTPGNGALSLDWQNTYLGPGTVKDLHVNKAHTEYPIPALVFVYKYRWAKAKKGKNSTACKHALQTCHTNMPYKHARQTCPTNKLQTPVFNMALCFWAEVGTLGFHLT